MLSFAEKNVLLGVCGSIAAYKACELASRLREQGVRVDCALTASARHLVQPAALEAITGTPVITDMFPLITNPEQGHIAVAQRVHLCLVAPATANILAKAACGIADDWLSTTLLATRAPLLFAPAMNTNMYTHPATQANISVLLERGAAFVGPASGRLACGTEGAGRLADIPDILDAAFCALHQDKDFSGKRILITSGPNHEPIDPVRFIGNRSSGKMGRALALEALCRGAEVGMITGPAQVSPPYGVKAIQVNTADEMYDAVLSCMNEYDVIIGAAAVADYKIERPETSKIKRGTDHILLRLTPNRDIIAAVADAKRPEQRVVGFAAESEDLLLKAAHKLRQKRLDMIIANTIGGEDCAIGADHADAYILVPGQEPEKLEHAEKSRLAKIIFDRLLALD
ncbi:MAG TPA: bifunctional phosphopantothenoylcysteine decarboxylase/phosphopantothenate--cysteine ligase CoaBC [Candidatus Hydrogenedentes bacterium]|nr:MAG: Coenzyme A biosynthesis bifunctional protein CoaBC [Candidatus Hydrogenedentes bacterium ADurb.Bin179]HOH28252.1 bifunctional phosphopantothenoylcysteine decarboxylase/phosphopantothenate--cysteine ligase CoaBC [Candidatus Hydrogenedentota bacterium]